MLYINTAHLDNQTLRAASQTVADVVEKAKAEAQGKASKIAPEQPLP